MEPHLLNVSQLIKKLHSSAQHGLSDQEVRKARNLCGPNNIDFIQTKRVTSLFFKEMGQPKIILFSAVTIALSFWGYQFAAILSSLIIILQFFANALLQKKAQSHIARANEHIEFACSVIRNNVKQTISIIELVPGDIIFLHAGQIVPADARIIDAQDLMINESRLTGFNNLVVKQSEIVEDEARLCERSNMAYKGTQIISGNGLAIVVATGKKTEIALHTQYNKEADIEFPFVDSIKHFSQCLLFVVWAMGILFTLNLFFNIAMPDWYMLFIAWGISFFPHALEALWQGKVAQLNHTIQSKKILVNNQCALQKLDSISIIVLDMQDLQNTPEIQLLLKKERKKGTKIILMSAHEMNAILPLAQEIGIFQENDRVLDVVESGYIADEELMRLIETTTVYAQADEVYKIKIIKLFNRLGKKVAYVGQNLGDLQVLKCADVGFARYQADDIVRATTDMVLSECVIVSIFFMLNQGLRIRKQLKRFLVCIGFAFLLLLSVCSIDYFSKTAIVIVNSIR